MPSRSETDGPPSNGTSWGLWLLLAAFLLGLGWSWRGQGPAAVETLFGDGETPAEPDSDEASAELAEPARILGRVHLEVPIEPTGAEAATDGAEPVPAPGPSDEDTDGRSPSAGDTEGDDAGFEPAPVRLEPATQCLTRAWQDGTKVGEAACDADGSFELAASVAARGAVAVEILVPGRLRAVLEVEVEPAGVGRLPDVALGFARAVRGQVVDGRGEPIENAEIQAMPMPNLGEPEPWRAWSGPDGGFVIDTLPPGPVAMRATRPGYAPSVVEAIVPQDDVLITLDGLFDLKGNVVGSPELLARATMRIEGSAIWPAKVESLAPDGTFTFEAVPDGVYAVEAVIEAKAAGEPEFASIPLENVTPDLQVTVALTRAHRVEVTVVDPEGAPVPAARVSLGNSQIGLLQRIAETDDAGTVRIGPVVPGPYVLRADADGYLPSEPIAVAIDGPDTPPQRLTLQRAGRIEGYVVDEEGRPVAGASVVVRGDALFSVGEGRARAQVFASGLVSAGTLGVMPGPVPEIPLLGDERASSELEPRTDEAGRFVLAALLPGRYELYAEHGRYATSETVELELGAGQVRGGVRLVLREGWRLSGRVIDDNRRPIGGALVQLDDGSRAHTDERGLFELGSRRGRRTLTARAEGKAARQVEVQMDGRAKDVEIMLFDAGARLDGRIEDGNRRPIAGAQVALRMLDGLTPTELAITDARGVYAFDGLPSGGAELEVDHPSHLLLVHRVELEPGRNGPVDLQLVSGWSLRVEVLEQGSNDPVGGADVMAGDHRTRTGNDGWAELRSLGEPSLAVTVEHPEFASARTRVQRPAAGDRAQARVVLVPGGSIRGRVIDYTGQAVGGSTVRVWPTAGAEALAETRTDGQGRWRIDGLPEGDVLVEAIPPPSLADELAADALDSDVLEGRVTEDVDLRLDRR